MKAAANSDTVPEVDHANQREEVGAFEWREQSGIRWCGFSREPHAPTYSDDWQSCARVLAFVLTGLSPAGVVHGPRRELRSRLAELP